MEADSIKKSWMANPYSSGVAAGACVEYQHIPKATERYDTQDWVFQQWLVGIAKSAKRDEKPQEISYKPGSPNGMAPLLQRGTMGVRFSPRVLVMREITALSEEHTRLICKKGMGGNCCSYLAMTVPNTWACAKELPDIYPIIDRRRAEGTMVAKGNNCSGPPDFKVRRSDVV